MTIYLYVKTHNKTGMKYLGKTTKSDPHKYRGSGKYWIKHLKKHGYDYSTEILRECDTAEELKHWGVYYSELWEVEQSEEWANLIPENGEGSSSEARWWNNGVQQIYRKFAPSADYVYGRLPFNNSGAKIGSDIQRGKFWVNNGITELMTTTLLDGFVKGRLLEKAFGSKQGKHTKGTHWWNNGQTEQMTITPPDGYISGRLPKPNLV